jgi:hypothetical protein
VVALHNFLPHYSAWSNEFLYTSLSWFLWLLRVERKDSMSRSANPSSAFKIFCTSSSESVLDLSPKSCRHRLMSIFMGHGAVGYEIKLMQTSVQISLSSPDTPCIVQRTGLGVQYHVHCSSLSMPLLSLHSCMRLRSS